MESVLEEFLAANIFAFILTFVRVGTAIMLIPGVGDSFVSNRIRLHMAVGLTFVMFPMILPFVPDPLPSTFGLVILIMMEFVIGLFFGVIARFFMSALDVAGMVVSISSGLANAQLFNPGLATQGSLVGAFLSVTGVTLIFVTNIHHLLFLGVFESYSFFPIGALPDFGSMAEMIARAFAASFAVGVKFAAPFLVLTLMVYVGMGVLARLMPQVQVFLLALPMQILLATMLLMIVLSAAMMFWLTKFEEAMIFFLRTVGA